MSDVKTAKYAVRIAALIERGEKACSNCEIVKPLAAFYPAKRAKGGINYGSWCRECTADQLQKARFALAFNITPDDSDKMLAHQKGCCAICGAPSTRFKRALAVDHDHATGLIRGRLCWYCNKLLGIAQDNPERLFAALVYLLCPPAIAALGAPRFGLPGRAGTKRQKKLARKLAKTPAPPPIFQKMDVAGWIMQRVFALDLAPKI